MHLFDLLDRILIILFRKTFLRSIKYTKGTEASNFINSIFKIDEQVRYLEIGVSRGNTIEAVKAEFKVAVDPRPNYFAIPRYSIQTIVSDSDTFFLNHYEQYFDFIYLDGLHHFSQTWRDFINATKIISPRGVIMIDDVVPVDKFSALIPESLALSTRLRESGSRSLAWHGDVFKVALLLSELPPNFLFMTVLFPRNPKSVIFCTDGKWDTFPLRTFSELKYVDSIESTEVFVFDPKVRIPEKLRPVTPATAIQLIHDFRKLEK